jgi:outer membrane protein
MKNAIFAIFLFVILFSFANNTTFSQTKTTANTGGASIGIVDVEAIVKEMPEAVNADKELIDLSKKFQDTLLEKRDALEAKAQNYEKQKGLMDPAKQQQELEKLQKEALELQNYQREKENDIAKRRDELLEPIRKKVKDAIEFVSKEEKLSLVLTKDNASVVMYFDPKIDITFRVIDRMKRGN